MILVIGGYAQGKLDYVLQETGREKSAVFDGILPTEKQLAKAESLGQKIVVSHFHLWIRDQLLQKRIRNLLSWLFCRRNRTVY